MKFLKNIALLLPLVMIISMQGCYYDTGEELYPNAGPCDTTNVTYAVNVKNIISDNCLVCHSTAANQGGISLETYSQVKALADNGKLVGAITHAPGFSPMPQNAGMLPECSINQIKAWISKGSLNN
jgi:hypothetical protein